VNQEERARHNYRVRVGRYLQMLGALDESSHALCHAELARACDLARSAYSAELITELLSAGYIVASEVVFPNGVPGSLYDITSEGRLAIDQLNADLSPEWS